MHPSAEIECLSLILVKYSAKLLHFILNFDVQSSCLSDECVHFQSDIFLRIFKLKYIIKLIAGLRFVQLETDSGIYIRGDIIAEVYVDDIKIVAPTMQQCEEVYKELAQHIKVESKGPIKSYLGIDIIRNWDQHLIALNQGAYIDRLVAEFGLTDAHTVPTPLEKTPLLAAVPGEKMCN
jgi:Reverse transcriptase (RNA-dependent DNA polymerase)